MEDIFLYIILIGSGISIGWWLREQHAIRKIHQFIQEAEAEENLLKEAEEGRTKMILERHGEVIYAYEEGGDFIAQGKDLHELDLSVQKRFPGKKFSIREDNLKEIAVEYHEPV